MSLVVPCGLLSSFGGFSPADVAGCLLLLESWDPSTLYDATTGGNLVSVGGSVARWEDKSGNANHAIQSNSAKRPIRRSSIVNGRDALDFDGTDDQLIHTANTTTATVIVAYQLQTLQSGYRGICAAGGNSASGTMILSNVASNKWGSYGTANMTANTERNTSWVVHSITDNNAGSCTFYRNGTSDGTVAQNALGQAEKHIGGQGTQESDAYVAAVAIYNSVLSAGDLLLVHNYFKSKLGIS